MVFAGSDMKKNNELWESGYEINREGMARCWVLVGVGAVSCNHVLVRGWVHVGKIRQRFWL